MVLFLEWIFFSKVKEERNGMSWRNAKIRLELTFLLWGLLPAFGGGGKSNILTLFSCIYTAWRRPLGTHITSNLISISSCALCTVCICLVFSYLKESHKSLKELLSHCPINSNLNLVMKDYFSQRTGLVASRFNFKLVFLGGVGKDHRYLGRVEGLTRSPI